MLPQVNARLLQISSGGIAGDWDQPAGPGLAKWQGDADAYVQERVRTALPTAPGAVIRVKDTSIVISSDLVDEEGNSILIASGDVFTFTFRGITHQRVASDEVSAYLPGMAIQEYVRVHFTNEAPEQELETE